VPCAPLLRSGLLCTRGSLTPLLRFFSPQVADEGSGVSLPSNPPSEARDVALLGACPLAAPCAPPLPGPAGAVAANPFGIQARLDLSTHLRLDQVRAQLLRQEDSILFGWLRRAAYRRNQAVYAPRGMEALLPPSDAHGRGQSLLEWHLEQTEARGSGSLLGEVVCRAV